MPTAPDVSQRAHFHRDRFTWLAYLLIGYYSYLLNGLGPALPFLRTELHGGYLLSSLHSSAFALGMIITGIVGDSLAQRWRRSQLIWLGAFGMAASTLVLTLGTHPAVTLSGVLLMGMLGTLIVMLAQAGLAEQHGEQRAIALTETTIFGSLCGMAAPFVISALATTPLGWRGALLLPVVVLGAVCVFLLRIPIPDMPVAREQSRAESSRFPGAFWMYWVVLVVAVAIEFCIIFWSVEFLTQTYSPGRAAAAALGWFLGAMLVGRWACSQLVRYCPPRTLLFVALTLVFMGFALHRWSGTETMSWIGLLVAGLGVAGLYPLTLSLAVGLVGSNVKRASALASLASGIAILALPLVLGWSADTIGLPQAYSGVVFLPVIAVVIISLVPGMTRAVRSRRSPVGEIELNVPVQ